MAKRKKKVLVASFQYSHLHDGSKRIMEILNRDNQCEHEFFHCSDIQGFHTLLLKIAATRYDIMFIVWDHAFEVDEVDTFTRMVRKRFPKLKIIAASRRPGCLEILMDAGCHSEIDTAWQPEILSKCIPEEISY